MRTDKMAVFFELGGDIYAGPTREAVLNEMRQDVGEIDEADVTEVPGSHKIIMSDENDEPTEELISLDDDYNETLGSYCIASDN
jgi:hypothetical protein